SKQVAINDEDCLVMIKSIYADVYVQSFPQTNRYTVYVILFRFLVEKLNAIRQHGSDFVCNFIQSMDGERDPRNLVICFQCLQYITKYLDIEPYKEELFDVVSCYFPIDFKPRSANDNDQSVTQEQLILSLRTVLTSTNKFAQYCIPMLIEKLDADIQSARIAAMNVFIHCVDTYEAKDIEQHLVTLWNLFTKQALCAETQSIESYALRSVTALVELISKSIQNDETNVSTTKFTERAIRELEHYLKEPDLKLIWPATKILQCVARSNSNSSTLILNHVLPVLIQQFNANKSVSLDCLVFFLSDPPVITQTTTEQLWNLLLNNFDDVINNCLSLSASLLKIGDNIKINEALAAKLIPIIINGIIRDELKTNMFSLLKTIALLPSTNDLCTTLLSSILDYWTNNSQNEKTYTTIFSLLPILFDDLSPKCIDDVDKLCQSTILNETNWQTLKSTSSFVEFIPIMYFLSHLKRKYYAKQFGDIYTKISKNLVEFSLIDNVSADNQDVFRLFYGNLINKLSLNEYVMEQSNELLAECEQHINQNSPSHLKLWTIVVKALTISRPFKIKQYIEKLVEWINKIEFVDDLACQSLKILTTIEDESFLSINADSIIHPLVKQIVFVHIVSYLKPLLENNDIKAGQMNVLIDLLNNVPKAIVKDELKSLLPILIRGLASSNENVWSSALKSLCDLIKNEPSTLVPYIDKLVPRLTTLAVYKNNMNIRITSLVCLKYLCQLPFRTVKPYHRHIVHVLQSCVDDHKRLVRKQAVLTQMAWRLFSDEVA
ncbi:unnamed protein product, partial [Didymodactylos carnosus]